MERVEDKITPRAWTVFGTFLFAHMTTVSIVLSLGIFLPVISDDMGLSPVQEGWLGASATLASLITAVPIGWWLSRYNPKTVTTLTLLVGVAALFIQGLTSTFFILIIGRFLFGATLTSRDPPRILLTQQWIPESRVILINGVTSCSYAVIVGLGYFLAPFLLSALGDDWRDAFNTFGLILVGVTVVWMLVGKTNVTPDYERRARAQEKSPLKSLLKYRAIWFAGIGIFGANVGWSALYTFWPTFLREEFDISLKVSGSLFGLQTLLEGIAGFILALYLIKFHWHRHVLAASGLLITAFGMALLFTGSIPLLVLFSFFFGISWGFFPIILTIPYELEGIKPREVAVASSLIWMFIWLGGVVGPLLVGFLHELSDSLFLAMIIPFFAPLLLTVVSLFIRTRPPQEALAPSTLN